MRHAKPITHVTSHFEPDRNDLRLSLAVDSVRFRADAKSSNTSEIVVRSSSYRPLGLDAEPRRNTRETFAELALELGFRELSHERGWGLRGTLNVAG